MKELTPEELRACARGAAQVVETGDGLHFARFAGRSDGHWVHVARTQGRQPLLVRADCSAGVVLDFLTDSPLLAVEAALGEGAREVACFDLWADGAFVGCIGGRKPGEAVGGQMPLPPSEGARRCLLHLPQSRICRVRTVALADGASFEPAAPRPTFLALGDSITQGMDSRHPSLSFPAVMARALGMHQFNCGVGGWVFDADSLPEPPAPDPAFITVGFGTNDFGAGMTAQPAGPYLERVRELYPDVPVFVFEPLWRSAGGGETGRNAAGLTLAEYRGQLRAIAEGRPGVTLVPMESQLPPGDEFLTDGLHPHTVGHVVLGLNAARALERVLGRG